MACTVTNAFVAHSSHRLGVRSYFSGAVRIEGAFCTDSDSSRAPQSNRQWIRSRQCRLPMT